VPPTTAAAVAANLEGMQRTPLETTLLGKTDLDITRVGFGAWAIGGGGWEFGWGPQDDDDSVAAIHRALELGVNWIDTAAAYGFGRSERMVGRALRGRTAAERPYVFTKASLLEGPGRTVVHSLKRDSILREAEASRLRLGVDAIDLYQIHWPLPDEDVEEGWAAFAELKEQGLVRHIGVSNFSVAQLRRAEQIAPVETSSRSTPSSTATPRTSSCPSPSARRSASSSTPPWPPAC
jgi:aryl-alcohol dehydrogenase-like predicted oxidoreductase